MLEQRTEKYGKILVTGATGNVGSLLVPNLISLGADVRALVRNGSKAQGLKDLGVELVVGDLDKRLPPQRSMNGIVILIGIRL